MKKTYMIPTIQVVKIETLKMVAASLTVSSHSAEAEGGMLSRESSVWDDDDDDY